MNLSEFIAAAMRIAGKRPPRRKVWVVDEGERAKHRRCDRPVTIRRSYRIDRNRYDPQTASRPKEAAKAARRAAKMEQST